MTCGHPKCTGYHKTSTSGRRPGLTWMDVCPDARRRAYLLQCMRKNRALNRKDEEVLNGYSQAEG